MCQMSNYRALLPKVTTFIFDYDGVLTTGDILVTEKGEALRSGNVKDGYALQYASKMGYNVAIISGGFSESIRHRMQAVLVKDVFMSVPDKIVKLKEYMAEHDLTPEEIVYVGDDIPDYPVMKLVGVPVCPADAAEEIKQISVYISRFQGGRGCARDIIEQVLKVQGKWMTGEAAHLW